jgi:ATP-dependent Lhr-like helicase
MPTAADGLAAVDAWFARQGWSPAPFQRRGWAAFRDGRSGLIHSPTGSGKSLAAWLGPVSRALDRGDRGGGLRVLWITPLRALAEDTAGNLREALDGVGLDWRVETRTGDTGSAARARQRKRLPEALITTPESLSLLLSYKHAAQRFQHLDAVIVDEWHELLGSKRGVQLELCLAWLRARPACRCGGCPPPWAIWTRPWRCCSAARKAGNPAVSALPETAPRH